MGRRRERYRNRDREPRREPSGRGMDLGIPDIMALYSLVAPERDLQVQMDMQKLGDAQRASAYAQAAGMPDIATLTQSRELGNRSEIADKEIKGREITANAGIEQQKIASGPQGGDIPAILMMMQQARQNGDMTTLKALEAYSQGLGTPFVNEVANTQATQKAAFDASQEALAAKPPQNSAQNLGSTVGTIVDVAQGKVPQLPPTVGDTMMDFYQGFTGEQLNPATRSVMQPAAQMAAQTVADEAINTVRNPGFLLSPAAGILNKLFGR